MKTWHFGINNDYLVGLVLAGKKRATTSIFNENDSATIGEESILVFDNEKKACITKTKKIIVTEFKNITENLALLEGEGTFEKWKKEHIKFFKSIDKDFNENTIVEFEIFDVVKDLVKK
jgi:uncharacterized protein YhfF